MYISHIRFFVHFALNALPIPGSHITQFSWFSAWKRYPDHGHAGSFLWCLFPLPAWWCMFCSGRLCRQARKWFLCARKDAGARLCVNTHLVFRSPPPFLTLHLLITSTFKNSISCLPLLKRRMPFIRAHFFSFSFWQRQDIKLFFSIEIAAFVSIYIVCVLKSRD
jgi:hypothetical protein